MNAGIVMNSMTTKGKNDLISTGHLTTMSDVRSPSAGAHSLRLVIVTMGVTPIVRPLLRCTHNVVGIIECAPRHYSERESEKSLRRHIKSLYQKITRRPSSLPDLARKKSIPYYFMTKRNSAELEIWLSALQPDLIVIFATSMLLKEHIYSIPRLGAINLHPSLLPKYRGPNPWMWTYYHADLRPGVTVHYLDSGEDTGDIIYQESFDITLGTRLPELYKKAIKDIGTKLLIKSIDSIAQGSAPRIPQPTLSPTDRARSISPGEGAQLIDWAHWPIERIWHFINGAERWLKILPEMRGIYAAHVWEIGPLEKCSVSGYEPGKFYPGERQPFLACRDGRILLKRRFRVKRLIAILLNGSKG